MFLYERAVACLDVPLFCYCILDDPFQFFNPFVLTHRAFPNPPAMHFGRIITTSNASPFFLSAQLKHWIATYVWRIRPIVAHTITRHARLFFGLSGRSQGAVPCVVSYVCNWGEIEWRVGGGVGCFRSHLIRQSLWNNARVRLTSMTIQTIVREHVSDTPRRWRNVVSIVRIQTSSFSLKAHIIRKTIFK